MATRIANDNAFKNAASRREGIDDSLEFVIDLQSHTI